MYHKIARGHAAAFMQDFKSRETFRAYLEGDRFKSLVADFDRSARAKRPGRVMRRLARHSFKSRPRLDLVHWGKHEKLVTCGCITLDRNVRISIQEDYRLASFEDDVLQQSDIILSADRFHMEGAVRTTANITRHAIQRLLERDGCTPEELEPVVIEALERARHLVIGSFNDSYPSATNSYLIPFRGGALAAINTPAKPVVGPDTKWDGLSIRTWLAPEMLGPERLRRVATLAPIFELSPSERTQLSREVLRDALDRAGRPYDFHDKPVQPAAIPELA